MTKVKTHPILALAFSTVFALGSVFAPMNEADAASLSEDKKVEFENAYFNNSVANKASRLLLKESPKTTANIKDQLEGLISNSDQILEKNKKTYDSLRPERENEDEKIKQLDKATFDNKVQQEAVFLLFELSPKSVENSQAKLTGSLNKAIKASEKGQYQLNKLRGYKTISVVHVNDTHGRVMENEKDGEIGFAKLKTYFDDKNVASNALLLNAGDVLHGTTFATISSGQSVVDVMNQMGFSAMAAGNHDFNYGYQRLVELNSKANFPILAANVIDEGGNNILDTDIMYDVDGIKVGVFGLSTEETKTKSSPANTEGLSFVNSVETAKAEVEKLKNSGAQIIICLSHLGEDKESTETSTLIAENVPGIDLIVDGHSHTELTNGRMVADTLIAQTKAHGNFIGDVTLLVDQNGNLVSKQAKLQPYKRMKHLEANKNTLDQIEAVANENKKVLSQEIGETGVELVGKREDVRSHETNLGDFIADAMIKATGADVAITNGGGIRASIEKGKITKENVLTVFPFTNYAVTLEVKGSVIKDALEHGLAETPELAGKFPQIGGMTIKYDSTKEKGAKVTEIMVAGEPIDYEKTYKLVTNDFMSIGGDGYEMFKDIPRLGEYELISEIFENAIKEAASISPETDNRIVDLMGQAQ